MSNLINYLARGIAIASIGYMLLLSFSIFSGPAESANWLNTLILQLAPALILAAMLWIAWGSPLLGGLGFIFLGLLPSTLLSGEDWASLMISAPILLTGAMFIVADLIIRFNEPQ